MANLDCVAKRQWVLKKCHLVVFSQEVLLGRNYVFFGQPGLQLLCRSGECAKPLRGGPAGSTER